MLYATEFGRIVGTEYVNAPAMLPTSQGVTPKELASMFSKSPIDPEDNQIIWPSVPVEFKKRWIHDPATSFELLPTVRRNVYDWWDYDYPIAPSIPFVREHARYAGLAVDWLVIRCPFCGDHHMHRDVMMVHPGSTEEALLHSLACLGPHFADCTKIRPLVLSGPNKSVYASARYFMVGIDRIPSTADLNSYFPMCDTFITSRESAPGYVYLLESSGYYKIGISSNPQKRIQSLQTSSPVPITVIHIEPSDRYQQLEADLHQRFADYRTQGEWFAFPETMIDEVIAAMNGGAS